MWFTFMISDGYQNFTAITFDIVRLEKITAWVYIQTWQLRDVAVGEIWIIKGASESTQYMNCRRAPSKAREYLQQLPLSASKCNLAVFLCNPTEKPTNQQTDTSESITSIRSAETWNRHVWLLSIFLGKHSNQIQRCGETEHLCGVTGVWECPSMTVCVSCCEPPADQFAKRRSCYVVMPLACWSYGLVIIKSFFGTHCGHQCHSQNTLPSLKWIGRPAFSLNVPKTLQLSLKMITI